MDNYYIGCPPKMNDGSRYLTNYYSETRRDENIKFINGLWRDDDYRYFLQTNGKDIMDKEYQYLHDKSCFVKQCVHKFPGRSTNSQMTMERLLYNSLSNSLTFDKWKDLRICPNYRSYRLSDN